MLYKKRLEPVLDAELFRNPTKEYRGAPFWAWNSKLDKAVLERQIEVFREMGFGGFHMHPRYGLATEYLSEAYMDAVSACIQKGKEVNMLSFLYDEDRWPSGFAGGLVTQKPKYRQRALYITKDREQLPVLETDKNNAILAGLPYLVGYYDVEFDKDGFLKAFKLLKKGETAEFEQYCVYCRSNELSDKYNFQTYTDLLQPEAVQEFIRLTHDKYYERFGDDYDKWIPAIFTDEPRQRPLEQMDENCADSLAVYFWTGDFGKSFRESYGYDLLEKLPYLVWDTREGKHRYVRYDYFMHAATLFENAYFKQVSEKVKQQNLSLTGHLMMEGELYGQMRWTIDAMRMYPWFDIPGVDMLYDHVELMTAKQAQSIVHQYRKEAMLSELYGVTGWDFDFKCLKMQGDWQAALGVTLRVPHLSHLSMAGKSKRDYPPSFQYQAPWYQEFKYIEDHFARLNTVLTRGRALVNVAVLHPIETTMLRFTTREKSGAFLKQQEEAFQYLVSSLLYGAIDFDFISEALLPQQNVQCGKNIRVGHMEYSAIVIPPVDTLRQTTMRLLELFVEKGGKVIFMGDCPTYIDGRKSDGAKTLYNKAITIGFDMPKLLACLEDDRHISIKNQNGERTDSFIYQLRQDQDDLWLFLARAKQMGKTVSERKSTDAEEICLEIKGAYQAQIYDTLSGEIKEAEFTFDGKKTSIYYHMYANDSLLLKLCEKGKKETGREQEKKSENCFESGKKKKVTLSDQVKIVRQEPNVVLFDMGRYSLDGIHYSDVEYVLDMNKHIAEELGIMYCEAQPYILKESESANIVHLQFVFESELKMQGLSLALERAEDCHVYLNGVIADMHVNGFYIDESIKVIALPEVKKGKNVIYIQVPFSSLGMIEACYLLGDFDVRLEENGVCIYPASQEIHYGALSAQGMPFYGGNLLYCTSAETPEGTIVIRVSDFGAPCVRVFVDGEDAGLIALAPFTIKKKLQAGRHSFAFVCFGNRNNTLGPVHNCRMTDPDYYITPASYEKNSGFWEERYFFQDTGILSTPVFEVYE